MPKIFVSYRRTDTEFVVGRIHAWLARAFGGDHVFLDIDTIGPVSDFGRAIDQALSKCGVVLVVIGNQWLNAEDSEGRRRLNDPNDFVRREIECSVDRSVPLLPLFLGREAGLPEDQLPVSIQPLARTQGAVIRPDPDFAVDCRRLIEKLSTLLGQTPRRFVGELLGPPSSAADLDQWIRKHAMMVEQGGTRWTFRIGGRDLMCQCQQSDDHAIDRMRIVAPIADTSNMQVPDKAQLFQRLLEANHHSALDPRYTVQGDVVTATFLHPLSTLTEELFYSGLQQVTEMVWTFGTSYSSSEIIYGDRWQQRRRLGRLVPVTQPSHLAERDLYMPTSYSRQSGSYSAGSR